MHVHVYILYQKMYMFIFYTFIYRPFEPTWDNHFDTTLKIHFFFLSQCQQLMLYNKYQYIVDRLLRI